MAKVSLRNVYKIFRSEKKGGDIVEAVKDFSMEIDDDEFIVFVGPSGCGKSTTLRMIAGLEDISKGEIYIDDVLINELEPADRDIAMVFQNYALYPHMTAYRNISFSLRLRKVPVPVLDENGNAVLAIDQKKLKKLRKELNRVIRELKRVTDANDISLLESQKSSLEKEIAKYSTTPMPVYKYVKMPKEEIDRRVQEAAQILDIKKLLNRRPREMSGGQRQRIALGRAIVRNPKVFLLDEPLSNLDAKLRAAMRVEITNLHQKLKTTFIYVTHDQVEAMTMGTRIVVMKDGIIQQIDTPNNLFDHPANVFVAGFIGTPQMNFFEGKIRAARTYIYLTLENGEELKFAKDELGEIKQAYLDGEEHDIIVGVRGENIKFDEKGMKANVGIIENLGSQSHVYFNFDNGGTSLNRQYSMVVPGRPALKNGDVTAISFEPANIHLFDKASELSIKIVK